MVEKLWKAMQFGLFFWWRTLEGTSGVLIFDLVQILKYMKKWNKQQKRNVFPCLARPDDHNLNGCGKVKEDGNFAPFHVPAISAFLSFAPQWLVVPISLNGLGKWREMAIEACAPQSGARAGILRWYNSDMVQFRDGTILRWYNSEMVQYVHFIKIVAKEHFGRKN